MKNELLMRRGHYERHQVREAVEALIRKEKGRDRMRYRCNFPIKNLSGAIESSGRLLRDCSSPFRLISQ